MLSLTCAERLRDRQKAQFESVVHGESHNRPGKELVPPASLDTPPVPSQHLSDANAPLSSFIDKEGLVHRWQMPFRFARATLEDIPDELRYYIFSFLSFSEIIRCISTCRTMYDTVKTSTELQYIIELGAQRLIEVHPRAPTISLAECLHILRNKM
ncbi:hypothetical protein EDB19DRAFT_1043446 [Suillus lakei]|nr:hypothetical protein EDB19DRAFT_1043446 [Suillus lakei]